MKLVCIKTPPACYRSSPLEIGKTYEVCKSIFAWEDMFTFIVVLVNGEKGDPYPKSCFVTVEDYRNEKINKIGL